MFKKNIVRSIIIYVTLIFFPMVLVAQAPGASALQAGRPPINFADMKIPQLTDADIKEALKFLEELPPEKLEELAQMGEEVIKAAESQGLDAREIFGLPSDEELQRIIQEAEQEEVQPAPPVVTPTIEAPKVDEKVVQPIASKTEILNARTMLNTIIDRLEEVSQKAEIDRKTREAVNQMSFLMNDIVSYLHILEQDNLTKYLFEKESAQLYQSLKRLEKTLNQLVPQFDLPESFYEGVNPYTALGLAPNAPWGKTNEAYQRLLKERDPFMLKKQWQQEEMAPRELAKKVERAKQEYIEYKEAYSLILDRERSLQAFEQIVQTITQAVFQGKLIDKIKEIIKRYEPEALKLKERQEKLETQSRKEQEEALRRRPPYTPMIFEPPIPQIPPAYPDKPAAYTPPVTGPVGKIGEAPSTSAPIPSIVDKDGKGAKATLDEKKDDKDKKRTPVEFGRDSDKDKKLDAKLGKRIENIEKEVKGLAQFVDEGEPDILKPRILFKDFTRFLSIPIPAGTDPNEPELVKTKQINAALNKMNTFLSNINKELWGIRSLPKDQQQQLRKSTTELIYTTYPFPEKIRDLIKIHYDIKDGLFKVGTDLGAAVVAMSPEKGYVFANRPYTGILAPDRVLLKDLNKGGTSMLENFAKSWKTLKDTLRS